ncbi:hypothetical protein Cabys_1520 [Caldithrix abyssi DSM 13497]|uniref:Uncharacterized protein n=1 Tax=Caldithrix abyssi DSM 13497 TaxID=880073 RepID=A0A1J1C6F2_CALAY|nr:hypothetical protein Cabys_1520 [Caldithrix abyssi DSM 13497]
MPRLFQRGSICSSQIAQIYTDFFISFREYLRNPREKIVAALLPWN